MNVIKHMEAAFIVSLAIAGFGSVAVNAVPQAEASVPAVAENSIATPTTVAVVKVSAKRLSASEKQQLLAQERVVRSRA
jgi:hypothetical protein